MFMLLFLLSNLCPTETKKTSLQAECESLVSGGSYAYYYANSCWVYGASGTWSQVTSVCTHFSNGHLAAFPTMNEVDKLYSKMIEWSANSDWYFWIGLHQANSSVEPAGNWQWLLSGGRTLPTLVVPGTMGWWTADPNNSGGVEHCALYSFSYKIYDIPCGYVYASLCQYDDIDQVRKYRRKFKGHRGHGSSVLGEGYVTDRLACGRLCTADPICHSFSFSEANGHCVWNHDDGTHPAYPIVADSQYDIHVWQLE